MLIEKTITNQTTTQKIVYRPLQQAQLTTPTPTPALRYSHREPILQLEKENSKRLVGQQYNKDQNYGKTVQQLDMSGTNLGRLNADIEERTNYFTRTGKYDSRYTTDRVNNFGTGSRYGSWQYSPTQSGRSSGNQQSLQQAPQVSYQPQAQNYLTPNNNVTNTTYTTYKFPQKSLNTSNISHTSNPSHSSTNHQSPYHKSPYRSSSPYQSPYQSQVYQSPRTSQKQDKFYDLNQPEDAFRYHMHEAKEQAKDNVRDNVKGVVGQENYQLMKGMKDAAGAIKDNAKEVIKDNVGEVVYGVANTAIAAKDVVAEGAHQAKQQAKQTTKQAVKGAVGQQNFNLMKYITDAAGQLKTNLMGPSKPTSSPTQPSTKQPKQSAQVAKSPSLNQVSPIQYSQRSFQKGGEEFAFFWVYGLIAIGFFLVIFQALK